MTRSLFFTRMLENFMGDEEFRIGIKRFLEKYKYANAVTKDLWKELEAISSTRLNITYIMDTWTRQMGFPVVQVHALTSQTIFFCKFLDKLFIHYQTIDNIKFENFRWSG